MEEENNTKPSTVLMWYVGIFLSLYLIEYMFAVSEIIFSAGIVGFLLFVFLVFLYFFPTYVAWKHRKNNLTAIMFLNLLLGWTFIGWVVALIWASVKEDEKDNVGKENEYLDELEKLADLKEKGILTQDEFEVKKKELLNL